jgi:hypothetical protein
MRQTKTDKDYDVTGPDKDGHVAVEWDVDTNIIWLSKEVGSEGESGDST